MSERVARFPRVHRDTLGVRIRSRLNELFDVRLEATDTRPRGALLDRANVLVVELRFRVRLAFDVRCWRATGYGFAAEGLDAVGRMVGGWRNVAGRFRSTANGSGTATAADRRPVSNPPARRDSPSSFRRRPPADTLNRPQPGGAPVIDMIGRRLGEFEVVRELGRGGMGVVYEAVQLSLNRRVALKVLGPGLGLTPRAVDRFHREAAAAARLHHTNIVPVYAIGEQDGLHFYAMELIGGTGLDRVIKDLAVRDRGRPEDGTPAAHALTGPYVEPDPAVTPSGSSGLSAGSAYFDTVARLAADVADALHHAHQHHVIHRDVKPGNLLLAPDGRVSVTDFGLARVLEEPGVTQTGDFLGTPAYVAPEQIAGGRIPVDHRCDVYSLGGTLYELLTLRPPFAAARRDQLLAMVVQKEPVGPRTVNPHVPRDLETICLKCLEKDPDRRYRTAQELADDLRRFVNRFAILARRVGPLGKFKKWVRRNPVLTAALGFALFAGAAAGVFAYQRYELIRQRTADEQHREEELRRERVRAALDKGWLLALAGDLAAAEAEIREAERLGAPAGEVHLLRGQVKLSRGDTTGAMEEFRRAGERMPESVAARALVAYVHQYEGRNDLYLRVLEEAERMPAATPEDLLFLGYVERGYDPARGMRNVEQALGRRNTVVGRMMRAELALELLLEERLTAYGAEGVLSDFLAARAAMPDSPFTIANCLSARLIAVRAHEAAGNKARARELLELARADARTLERFRDSHEAVQARWWFSHLAGEPDAMLDELRRSSVAHPYRAYICAQTLYRRGDTAGALTVLEPHRGRFAIDFTFALALVEQEDGRRKASDFYREKIAARRSPGWDGYNAVFILYILGRPADAAAAANDLLGDAGRMPLLRPELIRLPLRYVAGLITEDHYLREAAKGAGTQCNAHFTVGMKCLSEGDRDRARDHFQKSLTTSIIFYFPYQMSLSMLARMDQDPNWPHWIPQVAPMPRPKS